MADEKSDGGIKKLLGPLSLLWEIWRYFADMKKNREQDVKDTEHDKKIAELERQRSESEAVAATAKSEYLRVSKEVSSERIQLTRAIAAAKTDLARLDAREALTTFESEVPIRLEEARRVDETARVRAEVKVKELAEAKARAEADRATAKERYEAAQRGRKTFWLIIGGVAVTALTPIQWWQMGGGVAVAIYFARKSKGGKK